MIENPVLANKNQPAVDFYQFGHRGVQLQFGKLE